MKIKSAFTLAEVLITLAIIGVIASMTLPSLNSNVNTKTLETQTLKAYNALQNAAQRYLVENEVGSFEDMNFNSNEFIRKYNHHEKYIDYLKNSNESSESLDLQLTSKTFEEGALFQVRGKLLSGKTHECYFKIKFLTFFQNTLSLS